jgi:hypothetical protein
MVFPPFDHFEDDIAKGITIICGEIFGDPGCIRVDCPPDDLVGFQLFQLAGKHPRADPRYATFDIHKPPVAVAKGIDDRQLPLSADDINSVLQGLHLLLWIARTAKDLFDQLGSFSVLHKIVAITILCDSAYKCIVI